jgi:hypothetical protein
MPQASWTGCVSPDTHGGHYSDVGLAGAEKIPRGRGPVVYTGTSRRCVTQCPAQGRGKAGSCCEIRGRSYRADAQKKRSLATSSSWNSSLHIRAGARLHSENLFRRVAPEPGLATYMFNMLHEHTEGKRNRRNFPGGHRHSGSLRQKGLARNLPMPHAVPVALAGVMTGGSHAARSPCEHAVGGAPAALPRRRRLGQERPRCPGWAPGPFGISEVCATAA